MGYRVAVLFVENVSGEISQACRQNQQKYRCEITDRVGFFSSKIDVIYGSYEIATNG